jgi:hypothetical protein
MVLAKRLLISFTAMGMLFCGTAVAKDRIHESVPLTACIEADSTSSPSIGAPVPEVCEAQIALVAQRIVLTGKSFGDVVIRFEEDSGIRFTEFANGRLGERLVLAHGGRVLTASRIVGVIGEEILIDGVLKEDVDAMEAVLTARPLPAVRVTSEPDTPVACTPSGGDQSDAFGLYHWTGRLVQQRRVCAVVAPDSLGWIDRTVQRMRERAPDCEAAATTTPKFTRESPEIDAFVERVKQGDIPSTDRDRLAEVCRGLPQEFGQFGPALDERAGAQ